VNPSIYPCQNAEIRVGRIQQRVKARAIRIRSWANPRGQNLEGASRSGLYLACRKFAVLADRYPKMIMAALEAWFSAGRDQETAMAKERKRQTMKVDFIISIIMF